MADAGTNRKGDRSTAQWFCLIVGATLVLVGLLGFIADATFDTACGDAQSALDGDKFILFEVNGWHNVVHILTGLLLLVGAARHDLAKTIAIVFGLAYAVVTIIGLIDGKDVLGLIPVNPADNILHIALSALALFVGLTSTQDDDDRSRVGTDTSDTGAARA